MNILPTTPTTGLSLSGGTVGEDSAAGSNPLVTGGVVRSSTSPTTFVSGDAVRTTMTTSAATVVMPYSVPEVFWSYAAAAGGILNTTTAVTIKTSPGASLRNYLKNIQVLSETLTNATELVVRDGVAGTVVWRIKIPTTGINMNFTFDVPIRASTNTVFEVATLTASGAGAVYVNAQGFVAL